MKSRGYERIEGRLDVCFNGSIVVDSLVLGDDDIIHLLVGTLKKIIDDAKNNKLTEL